jgi:hypothetical protein
VRHAAGYRPNPANQYVADFVQHLNPITMLTAMDVMSRRVSRNAGLRHVSRRRRKPTTPLIDILDALSRQPGASASSTTAPSSARSVERDGNAHARIRERFIRRHPKSQLYVDFPDFAFFRLTPIKASMNGGFGRAYVLTGEDLMIRSPAIDDLAAMESGAIDHMNSDHSDAASKYAALYCKAKGTGWRICGLMPAGSI